MTVPDNVVPFRKRRVRGPDPFAAMVAANAALWATPEADMIQTALAADLAGVEGRVKARRAAEHRDQVDEAVVARKNLGDRSRQRVAAEYEKLKTPMSRVRAAQCIAPKVKLSEKRVYALLTELNRQTKNT